MSLGNKQAMANNIKHYLEVSGLSREDLATLCGVSYSTVTEWIRAKNYPRIDKIEIMANRFGVPKAALVEEHTIDNALEVAFNERPEMRTLFSTMEKSSPEEVMQAIKIIEALKKD